MTYRELFRYCETRLAELGIKNFQQESNWILNHYSRVTSAERMRLADSTVEPAVEGQVLKALDCRAKGQPLAHVFGEWDFYGHSFFVSSDTLIPRPETETLVDAGIAHLKKIPLAETKHRRNVSVLDVGAGSGCIGAAILLAVPAATLVAVERSPKAAQVLSQNLERHQLNDRAQLFAGAIERFVHSAGEGPEAGQYDLIVANPPYIAKEDPAIESSVVLHEPHEALFADEDGLGDIRRWAKLLVPFLLPNGAMGFEIGATQGAAALEIFQGLGQFSTVKIIKDLSGHDRVVWGER